VGGTRLQADCFKVELKSKPIVPNRRSDSFSNGMQIPLLDIPDYINFCQQILYYSQQKITIVLLSKFTLFKCVMYIFILPSEKKRFSDILEEYSRQGFNRIENFKGLGPNGQF